MFVYRIFFLCFFTAFQWICDGKIIGKSNSKKLECQYLVCPNMRTFKALLCKLAAFCCALYQGDLTLLE